MKNKFLLLSVVSALFALVVLPGVMAQDITESNDVSASIDSGDFVFFAASGSAFESEITFSTLSAPPVDSTSTYAYQLGASDTFYVADNSAYDGFTIRSYLGDDFAYSGTSSEQDSITYDHFNVAADDTGAAYIDVYGTDASATFGIIAASTSDAVEAATATYLKFNTGLTSDDYEMTVSKNPGTTDLFQSVSIMPVTGRMRLEKFRLAVPSGTNSGEYSATLFVVGVDDTSTTFAI